MKPGYAYIYDKKLGSVCVVLGAGNIYLEARIVLLLERRQSRWPRVNDIISVYPETAVSLREL